MKKSFFRTLIILLIIITIPFPAYADYGPIQIDSYYDDWEDKPHTEVYPGKNPPEKKINYVSLFRDESNVYVHVIFAQSNNQGITNMTIDLRTNLGDEDYFIVPDLFQWDEEMDVTELPDFDADNEAAPAEDTDVDTTPAEDTDFDTTPAEDTDVDTTPAENNGPDTPEQDSGSNPGAEEQNLLSGRLRGDIFIVADNEINAENPVDEGPAAVEESEPEPDIPPVNGDQESTEEPADSEESADPAADNTQGEEPESDASDESIDTGSEPAAGETGGEDQGDLLDLFDPEYNIDPVNILNQVSPDTAEEMESVEEDLNGNMNLNKSGFYGTWAFSVWNGLSQVGTGYYTTSEGEPDELELYIPLSSITDEFDGITEISMVIKKLGKQEIFSVGASTAPFIGIAAGAGIAMLSVGAYTYRKKRPLFPGKIR